MRKFYTCLYLIFITMLCISPASAQDIVLGADRLDQLLPLIKDKRVALVVNQTSILSDSTHLLDTLIAIDVKITKIFAPEHGFRGKADAGEKVIDSKDSKTGIPLVSLYGKNYKPTPAQLKDVDVIIFDIQDVGTRFYTYISTMHYIMEACAENDKACIILDRPNPNDYVDGPVLEMKHKSFVGMHPIPIVHGLTVGELAKMINGEGWLKDGKTCKLDVITVKRWKHGQDYALPVAPSPNLPNNQAVSLYPSLCLFEATNVSIGRGTDFPFQVIGAPGKKYGTFTFTPRSTFGSKNPPSKGLLCYGEDLREYKHGKKIELKFFLSFFEKSGGKRAFVSRPNFMDLLAGTSSLRLHILDGDTEESIIAGWQKDLDIYKTTRKKYLLYEESATTIK